MFTTTDNLSPFDVNMALDAGWNAVIPYTNLDTEDITPLVQDAIFSRGPSGVKRTGIFIGGRDMHKALEMLSIARKAMMPPFEVSVMADPSGAFTTAAGLIAAVSGQLMKSDSQWNSSKVLVVGGTGPVGMAASILAANLGAEVTIMSRTQDKAERVAKVCATLSTGDGTLSGASYDNKSSILSGIHVVLATAAAGVEVMNADDLKSASSLKVAADVNAVPPSGIVGLDVMSAGTILPDSSSSAVGVGALAIGNIKYQAQHRLLKRMYDSDVSVYFDYEDACQMAQEYVKEKSK